MLQNVTPFLLHWAITALSLWLTSHVFQGIKFDTLRSLVIAALLLGFANAIVRPLVVILTFPLTLVTLGLFLLVVNALMLLLVSRVMRGFTIAGFWTAFFASIFISLLSFIISGFVLGGEPPLEPPRGGTWI
jgi:putative membrane protein